MSSTLSGRAARGKGPPPSAPESVFINAPFDRRYEPLFLALIAGTVAFGRVPRCVLELPASSGRLERLMALIDSCGASFHDLSRVQQSRTKQFGLVPRFNMPFELGLAMVRAIEKKHSAFILEEVPHRAHATTSDISMFDPLIHGGTVHGILTCVLDAFGRRGQRQPTLGELQQLTGLLSAEVRKVKRLHRNQTMFSASLFTESIGIATALARAMRLLH